MTEEYEVRDLLYHIEDNVILESPSRPGVNRHGNHVVNFDTTSLLNAPVLESLESSLVAHKFRRLALQSLHFSSSSSLHSHHG